MGTKLIFPIVQYVDGRLLVATEKDFRVTAHVKWPFLYIKEIIGSKGSVMDGWIVQYDGSLMECKFICKDNMWLRPVQLLLNLVYDKYELGPKQVVNVSQFIERLKLVKRKKRLDRDLIRYLSSLDLSLELDQSILDGWPI
ncbi:hypothetical protein JYB88_01440 [Shewanella cyperi]|uniref:Uncharacterized protein n=1 Tax=Shewanella cyperi TaxID=2814292 RepID=A0A975AKG6_9GAMM|nr:hypothetical protein [Shewanella cyperi]QSX30357.1 hypothetical protein JYB88_01440 [Shewanella cyperi]